MVWVMPAVGFAGIVIDGSRKMPENQRFPAPSSNQPGAIVQPRLRHAAMARPARRLVFSTLRHRRWAKIVRSSHKGEVG